MDDDAETTALSPTVVRVIDRFAVAMSGDQDIPEEAAKRLDQLIRSGGAPKPEEIGAALFGSPEGET